ncbi:hypothetical protein DFH06DRAFT_1479671 [Mycena polygramma]|nr:hypothetical protein DFH06DRAFT_1479671 [Mycena polygramma]
MLSSRPTDIRLQAYAKTPGRENAQADRRLMMTGHGKQKQTQNPLGPQSVQPTRTKSLLVPGTEKTTTKSRPLGDKTPFPNRPANAFTTPLPGDSKLARLVLNPAQTQNTSGTTPASVARPSSARTHARAPRMSGSASKSTLFDNMNPSHGQPLDTLQFQTPATNGRPWDVSPLAPSPIALPAPAPEPEDDFDEIEYMPPKVDFFETEWVPPFDFALPDYAEVGRTLRAGACAYPVDDEPVGTDEWEVQGECGWEMPVVQLATLESDDPFHDPFHVISQAPAPAPSKRPKTNPAPLDLRAKLAHRPQARAPAAQTWAGAGPSKARTATTAGPAKARTGATTATTTTTTTTTAAAKAKTAAKTKTPAPATSARARARAYTTSTTTAPTRAAAGSGSGAARPPNPKPNPKTTTGTGGTRPPGPMKGLMPTLEAVRARARTAARGTRSAGRTGTGSGSGSTATAVGRSSATTAGSRPAGVASRPPVSRASAASTRTAASNSRRPVGAASPDDVVSVPVAIAADAEGREEEFLFDV